MSFIITGCVGVGSKGLFGTGVSVALDPRTVGTQIDDSIMQKTISAKIIAKDKKYEIFATTGGKEFNPELPAIIFLHCAGADHTIWYLQTR